MPPYKVIFDANEQQPLVVTFPVGVGMLLLAIGLLILLFRRNVGTPRIATTSAIIVSGLGMLLIIAVIATDRQFYRFITDFRAGNCAIVEGVVENFQAMPQSGHGYESFDVVGRHFAYSDFVATPGFHQSRFTNGPISPGLHVRITYIGDYIARIETVDPMPRPKPSQEP